MKDEDGTFLSDVESILRPKHLSATHDVCSGRMIIHCDLKDLLCFLFSLISPISFKKCRSEED